MEDNLIMVSYLKSGRCWWILRVYNDDTFDIFFTSSQPKHNDEIVRQRYNTNEINQVVNVGELKDWIKGVIGIK